MGQVQVFINVSNGPDDTVTLDHASIFRWLMKGMRGPQNMMELEAPGVYLTTQGVSLRWDVE